MASSKVCTVIPSSTTTAKSRRTGKNLAISLMCGTFAKFLPVRELGDLAHVRNLRLRQRAEFNLEPHAGLSHVVLLLPVRMQLANPADHLLAAKNLRRASRMPGRVGCCNKTQGLRCKQGFDIRFYIVEIHRLGGCTPLFRLSFTVGQTG